MKRKQLLAALDAALALLAQHGDGARLLAGGQTLLATLNMRLSQPELLIDLSSIGGLKGITLVGDASNGQTLRIGAMTTHTEIEASPLIAQHAPLLAEAAPHIAHRAIRNFGTFGGSIAYMYPISFTESGHTATTYYGYFSLFLEGGLWCGMGAAGTALAATMPLTRMTRFFTPLCFVLVAMALRPTAKTFFVPFPFRWTATTEGSFDTMPLPLTNVSVFAVPKSMARSVPSLRCLS